jgi:hypothetical protein
MTINVKKLVTPYFKSYTVNQFIESLTEPSNTIFYLFTGKHTSYTGGDTNVTVPVSDVQTLYVDPYKTMMFGKHITSQDVSVLVPRHDWVANSIFTQYTHDNENLYTSNFFTATRVGTNHYIFKCLYNNNNAPSTVQPDFNETSADDTFFETSDGYQWKYLYTIPKAIFDKFSTQDYIPVYPDANVTSNAVAGAIDVIIVENGGTGYNNYLSGQFNSTDININGNPLIFNLSANAASSNNYYDGSIITITEGTGKGEYRKINLYRVNGTAKQITVNNAFTTTPDVTSQYEISPYIVITGDGGQSINCEARALINAASTNSIYKVEILQRGVGYLFAEARANTSNVIPVANTAVLKVIIPPPGGHGHNIQNELGGTRLGISIELANTENNTIPADNDYRTIGILKDPRFSNVGITVNNISGTFIANEKLYQLRKKKIDGTISVNTTSNVITSNSVNFFDTFNAGDYVYVVDESGNEITDIFVSDGGAGYTTGEVLTFTGGGGVNAAGIAVTVDGAVINVYINSITSIGVTGNSSGQGFGNNQTLTIVGDTSGASTAAALSVTNGTGNLSSVVLTSGGFGYQSGETVQISSANSTANATGTITVTTGGASYANAQTASIVGASSTVNVATGVITTNNSGGVVSVSIINHGYNYVENETVTLVSSTSSNATAKINTSNGVIRSAILTNSGTGYVSAPTIGISTLSGSGANLTAVANATVVTGKKMLVQVGNIANSSQMTLVTNGLFTDINASIYYADVGATAVIDTFDVDLIQAQNSTGFFTVGGAVIGNTSLATANIESIQISNTSKPYTTFIQSSRYEGTISGQFINDEKVTSSIAGAFIANAYVYSQTLTGIYVTEQEGNFYIANTITGQESGATLVINNIYRGDLVPWSGEVVYIENIEPISRSSSQSETIKVVLEF